MWKIIIFDVFFSLLSGSTRLKTERERKWATQIDEVRDDGRRVGYAQHITWQEVYMVCGHRCVSARPYQKQQSQAKSKNQHVLQQWCGTEWMRRESEREKERKIEKNVCMKNCIRNAWIMLLFFNVVHHFSYMWNINNNNSNSNNDAADERTRKEKKKKICMAVDIKFHHHPFTSFFSAGSLCTVCYAISIINENIK